MQDYFRVLVHSLRMEWSSMPSTTSWAKSKRDSHLASTVAQYMAFLCLSFENNGFLLSHLELRQIYRLFVCCDGTAKRYTQALR